MEARGESNPRIKVLQTSAFPLGFRAALRSLARPGSVRTTERYCAPNDRSRRHRLARILQDAHKRDPPRAELYADPAQEPGRESRFSSSGQAYDFKPCTGFPQ